MIWWLLLVGAFFVGGTLVVLAVCWAAARGDRALAQARENLAGPEGRDRVGVAELSRKRSA